jgi:membrane protease YdiL (CAAX protease family)
MRRAVAAFFIIAALWTAALAAFVLFAVRNYAPNTGYIVLLVGLWLTALVTYGALLNPEGRFSRYVIVAAASLTAASLVVGVLMALLTPSHTQVPPG